MGFWKVGMPSAVGWHAYLWKPESLRACLSVHEKDRSKGSCEAVAGRSPLVASMLEQHAAALQRCSQGLEAPAAIAIMRQALSPDAQSKEQAGMLTCQGGRGQAKLLSQVHDSAAGVATRRVYARAGRCPIWHAVPTGAFPASSW